MCQVDANYLGIDTAAKISAKAAKILRENGISFAARYLVPNSGSTAWKALTASEAKGLRDAGLAILLCWETTANRMAGGYDVGQVDGAAAKKLAENMGIPAGTVIYFAADYAVPESDFEAVYQYLYAATVSVYPYKPGLYGSENIVREMNERHACDFFWQCVGGSNLFLPCAKTIQYESQYGADAKALAAKVGFAVDLDSADSLDGMWQCEKPHTEEEDALAWARKMGIIDDTMRDVTQEAVMLYRYHRIYTPEDYKSASGLLAD